MIASLFVERSQGTDADVHGIDKQVRDSSHSTFFIRGCENVLVNLHSGVIFEAEPRNHNLFKFFVQTITLEDLFAFIVANELCE